MVLRPSLANRLEVQWEGPLKVVKKVSDTDYALERRGRRVDRVIYHRSLMKHYGGEVEKVSSVFNSAEEVTPEIPELAAVVLPMEVDDVMKAVAPTEGLTETQKPACVTCSHNTSLCSQRG